MKKQAKELCSEGSINLSGNKKISQEKLQKVMEKIKAFCKVAYQLYGKHTDPDRPTEQSFESKPPEAFKNLKKAA